MTVSYQYEVASSTGGGFTRLLFLWKGSLYKLIYRELAIFLILFNILSLFYRNVFNEQQKRIFEKVVVYCDTFINLIPLSFVLGFYVTYIATRWWQQYMAIPWPDKIMHNIALYIPGNDEKARLLKRSLMRYLNLTLVLILRSISSAVKKRFPTMDHLVEVGFMTPPELESFQSIRNVEFNTYWIPCTWFIHHLRCLKEEDSKLDSNGLKLIMEQFNEFRSKCGLLWSYDWISIPLVYTQVVTLATYCFFIGALFGRQYIENIEKVQIEVDMYLPVFTILQFFFYMGLLKVAEQLINPFGDDEEDFELNWLIDRHTKVSYLGVDTLMLHCPPLIKDKYFDDDNENIVLPYTGASFPYKRKTFRGSVHYMYVPEEQQNMYLPEIIEETESDECKGSVKSRRSSSFTSFEKKMTSSPAQDSPSTPGIWRCDSHSFENNGNLKKNSSAFLEKNSAVTVSRNNSLTEETTDVNYENNISISDNLHSENSSTFDDSVSCSAGSTEQFTTNINYYNNNNNNNNNNSNDTNNKYCNNISAGKSDNIINPNNNGTNVENDGKGSSKTNLTKHSSFLYKKKKIRKRLSYGDLIRQTQTTRDLSLQELEVETGHTVKPSTSKENLFHSEWKGIRWRPYVSNKTEEPPHRKLVDNPVTTNCHQQNQCQAYVNEAFVSENEIGNRNKLNTNEEKEEKCDKFLAAHNSNEESNKLDNVVPNYSTITTDPHYSTITTDPHYSTITTAPHHSIITEEPHHPTTTTTTADQHRSTISTVPNYSTNTTDPHHPIIIADLHHPTTTAAPNYSGIMIDPQSLLTMPDTHHSTITTIPHHSTITENSNDRKDLHLLSVEELFSYQSRPDSSN